ncbi:MAG: ribosome biogenesis GTP-binding protein YihA/YsxC [Bacteroidales bacterium]
MIIKKTEFIKSCSKPEACPETDKPEFAFVGRSNVGKSSLLNMLANNRKLAKTSSTPGKTRLINYFLINDAWLLVDLPGYGYARTGKSERKGFLSLIKGYLLKRQNLYCLFVLIDCRHKPLASDLEFIEWLGVNRVPFVICFTKTDKLSSYALTKNTEIYKAELNKTWDMLPEMFFASVPECSGRDELLGFINGAIQQI